MREFMTLIARTGARAAISAAIAFAATGSAFAATTISSNATDLKVALSLVGIGTSLNVGTASGTAGAPYNVDNTFAAVNQSLGLGVTGLVRQGVSTGILKASASSNGTTGTASATINNLALGLTALGANTFSLGSSLITSTTTYDGANFVGTSNVANLAVSNLLGSIPLDAGLYASTAANRVLVDILGLKVTLNEQISASDITAGISTNSLTTNALHVSYKDFLVGGSLLSGDIIVGQSQVSVAQAVPEPATWALMIVGFGMVGGALRSQRRTTVRAFG